MESEEVISKERVKMTQITGSLNALSLVYYTFQ
jgi:hypothetical protein